MLFLSCKESIAKNLSPIHESVLELLSREVELEIFLNFTNRALLLEVSKIAANDVCMICS